MSYSTNCFDQTARQQFGNLQHRTFPIYFTISMGLASALLGLWTYAHPAVLQAWAEPLRVDVFQAYTLTSVILAQGLNYFIIGPMTSKYVYYLSFLARLRCYGQEVLKNIYFVGACSRET